MSNDNKGTANHKSEAPAAPNNVPDDNDIRMALGTVINAQRAIGDALAELDALVRGMQVDVSRLGGIADQLENIEDTALSVVPRFLRTLPGHPMLGSLVGEQALQLADSIEDHAARRRAISAGV